jgi:hypothetical protein
VDPTERDVLGRCLVARSARTIAFLHAEADPGTRLDVDAVLGSLAGKGMVTLDVHGRWTATDVGRAALDAVSRWEVVVESIGAVAADGLADVRVAVLDGRPFVGDWFRVPGRVGSIGRVVAWVTGADPDRPELATVHVDVDVEPGDLLQRFDPRV